MAIPSQQDYNRCDSGPVARERERERWALRSCVYILSNTLLYFIIDLLSANWLLIGFLYVSDMT